MTTVFVGEDCGNAPRKQVLRDFNIAWARGDAALVLALVAADMEWNLVGSRPAGGKEDLAAALAAMAAEPAAELVIDQIITHGVHAAANGTITFNDGRTDAFCHVYRFSGHGKKAKIKAIKSYVIAQG